MAVPFTTPIIAQSRCRPNHLGKIELIVPNPSGGDGNYVMPLSATLDFCTPSIHDQYLIEQLEALDHIDPSSIRSIALEAAKQGYAGRLAAKAARQRSDEDQSMIMLSYLILFVEVLKLAGYKDADWRTLDVNHPKTRARTKTCLVNFAPTIGLEADRLLTELEKISRVIAFVGLGQPGVPSPAQNQLAKMKQFNDSLAAWQRVTHDTGHLPGLILDSSNLTIEKVETAIAQCRKVSANLPKLIRAWFANGKKVHELFSLADWMLDGWQHICALWMSVEDHGHHEKIQAMHAIADLIPLIPGEADKWVGGDPRIVQVSSHADRRVRLNEDWRTGTIRINSREHQEQLRAFA